MPHDELYLELSKKVGTQDSQIVPEIWRLVCSPEEAALLNALPASAEDLARLFNRSPEAISGMLAELFHKGVVFKANREGKTVYRMPKHIIQFHDASSLWPEAPPELLRLWRQYTEKEYPKIPEALAAMNVPPFFRVIPINEKIEAKSRVLVYEDAVNIVEQASVIAVTKCPCRMIMHKCDKPVDVCLQLNRGAQYAIERGTGRQIDAAEAKSILRRAEEAGLVHLTENKAGVGTVICNCCNCCCIALPYAKGTATCGMLVPSRYQAKLDPEACTGCGICADDCPMRAITVDGHGIAAIEAQACIGCGVCTNVCPVDAIILAAVRPEDFIPS